MKNIFRTKTILHNFSFILVIYFELLSYPNPIGAQEARLLRFPTIHQNNVVFCYAGNLYSADIANGISRRLTSHEGYEMFPRYSPDGKWIAFTGQYDGNTEVYLIPSQGGSPKRLTYTATLGRDDVSDRMGPNNIVIGWKHNSKEIIFRSRMTSFNDFLGQLYTISIEGGIPEELPLPRGGFASYSPDDKKIAYNRIFREFRTWKRYRGGMCDDISIYDFQTKKTETIAPNDAQDIIPMWSGNKIYFLSDRDENKRFNLYAYDLNTKQLVQKTKFKDFDCKFPSLGNRAIIFENGGFLYTFDLTSEKISKLKIEIHEDQLGSREKRIALANQIREFDLSPDGKQAVLNARGELFTVSASSGFTKNLTNSSGVHERSPSWSPDGKWIAAISDQSGEEEIVLIPADGHEVAKPITTGGDTYKYDIVWSPDGKKILWADKKLRLQYIEVDSKKVTLVEQSKVWEIRDYSWSPDSQWIAYTQPESGTMSKIALYSLQNKKTSLLTDGWYGSSQPSFSSDGKYLFFVSSRDFNPIYSQTEWNHAYQDMARIYLITLAKGTANPLKPKFEDLKDMGTASDHSANNKDSNKTVIDLEGIQQRVVQLPVIPANYRNLQTGAGLLYYFRRNSRDRETLFFAFDVKAKKEMSLGTINNYVISHDQKKMLVSRNGIYAIIDLPKGVFDLRGLNLSGLEINLNKQAEWKQIYNECWRQMRDFFYAPNMHGVDWLAVKKKYEVLLPYVQHRADLTYIIGEMIGELNCGHTYVGGGESPKIDKIPLGLLGATLKRDPKSGYYKIIRILHGENWNSGHRSPLSEIGVNVHEGDYLISINDKPVNEVTNPFELLVNQVNKPVSIKVNSTPSSKGARTEIIQPIGDEGPLYYYDWVQNNIKKVTEASKGKIGYIHVPDMSAVGLNEFVKHYYPQLGKKALIIDVRGNGGGNVSPMLIERLRREIIMVDIARNGPPTVDPSGTFVGPMLCLVNEFSASDGDLFPYRFKQYKLGPLVGKRTWGGVVGIRGSLPLLDGGSLNKPEFSRFDLAGKEWIIEGHGVDPDIVVDNDPALEFAGKDQQLNRGVEILLEQLKSKEKKLPTPPPFPKK